VDALVKLTETPAAIGRIFNLGGQEEISINDLARKVIALSDSKGTIEHVSYEQAYGHDFEDMPRRVPRLDRIREAIGFAPRHNLDDIVRSVIAHQRQSPAGTGA
jgi:UDP-glucose 4-epimerase